MAKYGARYIKWAPFASSNPEPENALPNYGTAMSMNKLVKVTDNPSFAEGKIYGDDSIAEYASEFTENAIDVEISDMDNTLAAAVFGATKESNSEDLVSGADDAAPYGGFGFISLKMVNGKKSYVGIFYPKCKAVPQGEEYNTKGENITFTPSKVHFVGTPANNGAWKIISKEQTTLEAAKAWLDGKLSAEAG